MLTPIREGQHHVRHEVALQLKELMTQLMNGAVVAHERQQPRHCVEGHEAIDAEQVDLQIAKHIRPHQRVRQTAVVDHRPEDVSAANAVPARLRLLRAAAVTAVRVRRHGHRARPRIKAHHVLQIKRRQRCLHTLDCLWEVIRYAKRH